MLPFVIFIGKSVLFGLRLTGRHGSALPGLIIERLYRPFLTRTLGQLPDGVIVVTGTNGKTTTTKIIAELLSAQGLRVLTNGTGSNFVRGIIATVLDKVSSDGRLPYDIAVFEQDEAHAVRLLDHVTPRGVVALNVMRDQMDRFGEIDATARLIGQVVGAAAEWVVLNANDTRIAELQYQVEADMTYWFGHAENMLAQFVSDDQHHSRKLRHYSATVPDVTLSGVQKGVITVDVDGRTVSVPLRLDGTHNAINAVAALAAVRAILPSVPVERFTQSLGAIEPAFGRGERIRLKTGGWLKLQLVKNPAGFTHALRLLDEQAYMRIGIVINDDYADGRDVSWLWDVDFSGLPDEVITGGRRAHDMALRLKYDEIAVKDIRPDIAEFIDIMTGDINRDGEAIVFTTYTAMLKLRRALKTRGHQVRKVGV